MTNQQAIWYVKSVAFKKKQNIILITAVFLQPIMEKIHVLVWYICVQSLAEWITSCQECH